MANRRSKVVSLDECSVLVGQDMDWEKPLDPKQRSSGKDAIDIRDLVADINYYESIDSPFLRCDITIVDAIDLYKNLRGKEVVKVKMTSESSDDDPIEVIFRIFKIGSFIKNERAVMYILHLTSNESFLNEARRMFGAYGPCEKHQNKEHLPKHICKDILKAPNNKIKGANFEAHGPICFYSPNWRPLDAITYISDKVLRQSGGGGGRKSQAQSGFLFYENKHGFHFRSIDGLCSQSSTGIKYTYAQQSVEAKDPKDEYFRIESATYPDKTNHLEKLRTGLYKTSVLGISIAAQGNSFLPSGSSSSSKDKPNVKLKNYEVTMEGIFKMADTIDTGFPTSGTKFPDPESMPSTRYKFRVLPSFNHQPKGGSNPNGGESPVDSIQVSSYATARYSLLNAIQLNIKVPGNTKLAVGEIIEVSIPLSTSEDGDVQEDRVYSGKYLIAGLHHLYRKEGMTTTLYLTKDSVREDRS